MDYSDQSEESQDEPQNMPEWRLQVARRLLEIRQRRLTNFGGGISEVASLPLPFPEPEKNPPQTVELSTAREAEKQEKPQLQIKSPTPAKASDVAERKELVPRVPRKQNLIKSRTLTRLQLPRPENLPAREEKPILPDPLIPDISQPEVRNLIDDVVIRRIVPPSSKSTSIFSAERRALSLKRYEDKLILLSRAFSGMVDLIIIALCAGTFIFAADAFSGIVVVDAFSWINYCLLFFLTYFVYSFYFLGTINQTIGMMITDLRVVDEQEKRPGLRLILGRLSSFVPSFLIFGAGLIWGIFDHKNRCLHDRFSSTHVVRL
jgi:uncharacterized RDD family membrane protein YckC